MLKNTLFAFLLLLTWLSSAQKRSLPEWLWALSHPFAALKVKKISKECYRIYTTDKIIITELDHFSNGGKLDAFRHVFFMAAFSQKIKIKKLRKLGKAHEKGNYKQFLKSSVEDGEVPDSLSSVMDLKNNEVGFVNGTENKTVSLENLRSIIITKIKAGEAFIMKRKINGLYIDCSGAIINTALYKGKWTIPKCLVPSDYVYKD
ncbi:MAG: hypothetical protein HYX39_14610 [Bacteroidetes bacterium]|nr:hypothetical protein [Bacteroidota bacterium]